MTRVLLVQTAFLGDVVLTTPLLRALRGAAADVDLTVVATPLGAETLAGAPWVDRIVPFDKVGADRGFAGTVRIGRRLRQEGFEVALAAQRSFRTGLLLRASGARERVGFKGGAGAWAYTRRVPWLGQHHAVRRYLELARALGVDPDRADPRPELRVDERARSRVDALLCEEGIVPAEPVLCLAPGSVWGTKRWLAEGFAAVARASAARGLRPVLVGSPQERALCEQVRSQTGSGVAVLAGRTGVREMTALLARSRALVSNDSGPGHLASAVGTAVVAVFGPTVPEFGYTPFGERNRIVEHPDLECRPCHTHGPQVCPLEHHRCMRDIAPQQVIRALDEVLATSP